MSYPGNKGAAGTWQRIIGQMPPHSFYFETHYGSGEIFKRKRRAAVNVLIDVDGSVLPVASTGVFPIHDDATKVLERFRRGSRWLLQIAGRNTLPPEALIYADPPYPLGTRSSRRYYRHEMTDDDHAALLSTLVQLPCMVMISTYPNALYSSQLRNWRCVSYKVRTRGRTMTELLYCNFPEPAELHDWRYAGKNYRERTELKRLAARWNAKLDRMTPRRRGYVLDSISQREDWRCGPLDAVATNGKLSADRG